MRRYKSLRNKPDSWKRASRGALDAREQQEKKDYATVHARSGGQCEVVLRGRRCHRVRMPGVHHTTKRSQGGRFMPSDYLLDICDRHHDLADNAHPGQRTMIDGQWVYGRLRMSALGGGKFRFWMETAVKTTTGGRPARETPTNRLSRETLALNTAPKAPERSEAS